MRRLDPCLVLIAMSAVFTAPVGALTCNVPATRATIQQAVDDGTCTTIQLASQTFSESVLVQRTLTLVGQLGGGSVLAGQLSAAGAGVVVSVAQLQVENGCPETLAARNGARIESTGVTATHASALGCVGGRTFRDSFESGDTHSWSATSP